MDIKEFLDTYGVTRSAFARRIKVSRTAVNGYIDNRFHPSHESAQRIIEYSKGQITLQDLRPEEKLQDDT